MSTKQSLQPILESHSLLTVGADQVMKGGVPSTEMNHKRLSSISFSLGSSILYTKLWFLSCRYGKFRGYLKMIL
jgi:hypothetical protein